MVAGIVRVEVYLKNLATVCQVAEVEGHAAEAGCLGAWDWLKGAVGSAVGD